MAKTPAEWWHGIAESELARPGIAGGTGFGRSQGLRVSGKIFAMLVDDELVVKLPTDRVRELTAMGVGRPFDPGHGRLMKEWASVGAAAARRWRGLVEEARVFVGEGRR